MVTQRAGHIEAERLPFPADPGAQDVRLAVERVGICGSDAHIYNGRHPYLGYPVVQGHEIAGTVLTVGAAVAHLQPGDRVVVDPVRPCFNCIACRRGRTNCCINLSVVGVTQPGGLAEEMVAPARYLHRVGDLDLDAAVFVEPLTIALRCLARARLTAQDTVLVLGAGSIGRAVVLAVRSAGARVMVADRAGTRRELSARLGAERAVELKSPVMTKAVDEFTGGDGPTVVIETTGSAKLLRLAVDLVAHSGTVVVVGISAEDLVAPVATFTRKEVTLLGSRNSVGSFPEAIELARCHALELRATITDRFGLLHAESAIRLAARRITTGKIVVDVPSRPSSA